MKTDNKEQKKQAPQAQPAPKEEKSAEPQAPEKSEAELLKEQLAALDDKYKRALAEYDNFRKRSVRERESAYGDGMAAAVSVLLPIMDNLDRAAAQENAESGVAMMQKQAAELLAKLNVKPCGKKGDPFDPNYHNAVQHTEDESLGENVVAEVLLSGYTMGDRLLRPAMVKAAN